MSGCWIRHAAVALHQVLARANVDTRKARVIIEAASRGEAHELMAFVTMNGGPQSGIEIKQRNGFSTEGLDFEVRHPDPRYEYYQEGETRG